MIIEPPSVRIYYRAILTLRALPDPDARYFPVVSPWIQAPRDAWFAYEANVLDECDELDRYTPSPQDVQRYLDILAWGRGLSRLQYRILECRAEDYSIVLIADLVRCPLELVHTEFRHAIRCVDSSSRSQFDKVTQNVPFFRPAHCA